MAIHDYVIDNDTAANVRSDINDALAAIRSSNLSPTEPTSLYAGLFWFDTTNDELKIRNEANDGWILMGKFSNNKNTNVTPTGSVLQFAGSSAPDDWLLCNGALVSRTTYADLFNAIGTAYGAGDGSTTFKLPDFRGRIPVGAGQGSGLTNRVVATTGGAETHTLDVDEMPAHSHNISVAGTATSNTRTRIAFTNRTEATDIATAQEGSGDPHNNMQPFLVVNYIIKV